MKRWLIRAHGRFEYPASDAPADLMGALTEVLDRPPRRINRYTQLALIGAHRAAQRLDAPLAPDTPLYLASEHGGIAETVNLMDSILFEHRPPKPMSFINVPSNMAGFYTAASLGLSGHNMTVSRHYGSFGAMLELAALDTRRDQPMLLGLVGEAAWPLAEHRYRRGLAADTPLTESSLWLVAHTAVKGPGTQLQYATTQNPDAAARWLAEGDYWALDPQLRPALRRRIRTQVAARREWPEPGHRGNPNAIISALFTALEQQPLPHLRLVARDSGHGYQLFGLGIAT